MTYRDIYYRDRDHRRMAFSRNAAEGTRMPHRNWRETANRDAIAEREWIMGQEKKIGIADFLLPALAIAALVIL